jgi:hypothetical protein
LLIWGFVDVVIVNRIQAMPSEIKIRHAKPARIVAVIRKLPANDVVSS